MTYDEEMKQYEVLVLAAKAGRISYVPEHSKPSRSRKPWGGLWLEIKTEPVQFVRRVWNPLRDDGDALRLANAVGMRIETPKYKGFGATASPLREGTAGATAFRDDPGEQLRLAITLCAAEVGKAM